MDFSSHEQHGNLLVHDDDGIPAGFKISDEQIISFEDRGYINNLIMLGDAFVLGYDIIWKCYHTEFVA